MSKIKEKARKKAVKIIESCTTCEHFETAKSYLDLFLSSFEDDEMYDILLATYEQKKQELNCNLL